MKSLIIILLTIVILVIYIIYKFFNWLLIEKDPILNPVTNDRSTHKNNKIAKKGTKDQNNFALTEISNWAQMSNKATQNEPIIDDISIYNNKKLYYD